MGGMLHSSIPGMQILNVHRKTTSDPGKEEVGKLREERRILLQYVIEVQSPLSLYFAARLVTLFS